MGNYTGIKKKPIYKKWWFWVIIIIAFVIGSSASVRNSNTIETVSNLNASEQAVNKSKDIYNKNNILIKITDYKYHITGALEVYIYIENNTNQDLTFATDGSATLNDYSTDIYLYEVVNQGTKSNTSFILRGLNANNIKEEDLSKLKFKLDIYHSDNYYIDNRIEDDFEIIYEF